MYSRIKNRTDERGAGMNGELGAGWEDKKLL